MYFAHPINTYGTVLEEQCLALLRKTFPHHEIVNPSDQVHKDVVAKLREKDPKADVMPYFIDLVRSCDDLAALSFGDGMWGADVYAEAVVIDENGGDIWGINPWRMTLYTASPLDESKKLSVDDTRLRIRNPNGTPKPYE